MKHLKPRHSLAFTLIQLLLLIAVIAAMSVYALRNDQDTIQTVRTEQVAVEIQRTLEASVEYYKKHARWPTAMTSLTNDKLLPEIPSHQGGMTNPWGKPYELLPLHGEQGEDFAVKTIIPSKQVIDTLKAFLPNVSINNQTVQASITSVGKENDLLFVGAEQNIDSRDANHCPSSMTGCLSQNKQQYYEKLCHDRYGRDADFDVALQSFQTGTVPIIDELMGIINLESNYDFYDVKISKQNEHGRWGFRLTLDEEKTESNSHEGQAVMFIYCKPIAVNNQ